MTPRPSSKTWRQRRHEAHQREGARERDEGGELSLVESPDTTNEPGKLALLTEFHEQVKKLPDEEQTVFELRYYGGFSQAEISRMLGLQLKQVSRRWLAATEQLAQWLKAFREPF
jgi:RNA polymerase sigma factor (sigma-70 family)